MGKKVKSAILRIATGQLDNPRRFNPSELRLKEIKSQRRVNNIAVFIAPNLESANG